MNALSATLHINHAGGQIPHCCRLLVCLIRQMDRSVSLSALTYFSLSSSAGWISGVSDSPQMWGCCACPHTSLLSWSWINHFSYGGGLHWFSQPSCDLFLSEGNKCQKHLPSDHLHHAGNGSPMFLCGIGVSGQTGPVVWEHCWPRSPWGTGMDIHPSSSSPLGDRRDEFGWRHFSYPARLFGVLKGDNEVRGTLKTATMADSGWPKRLWPQGPEAARSRGSQAEPGRCGGARTGLALLEGAWAKPPALTYGCERLS